jgi:hypothetical protein
MQNASGGGSSKLTLFVVSVVVLVLFCFAAVPPARASTTSYNVTFVSGGIGSGCASGDTGTITINSTTDSLEFTSSSGTGCYFGEVTTGTPVAGTTVTTYDAGPTTQCTGNCSDLATLGAGDDITFMGANVGACSPSSKCSTSETGFDYILMISSLGFTAATSASPDIIVSGSNGGSNTPLKVAFDDPTLVTPEPVSFLLFGSGLLVLGAIFRKKLGLGSGAV